MSDEKKDTTPTTPEQPGDTSHADVEMIDNENQGEADIPTSLPVLPVRDIVVFNYMILPLYVGREKSVQAIDEALNRNRYVLICTQKDEEVDDPGADDLYSVGTVGMIMRMLKMPDGRLKVLVQGLARARVKDFIRHEPYDEARIELIEEREVSELGPEQEALLRTVKEQTEKILSLRGIDTSEIMAVLNSVNQHGRLADLVVSNLRIKPLDAQKILECEDPVERLILVNEQLTKEVEVASMQAKIQSMAREGMDKAQREYFLREQLKAIRKELGDMGENGEGGEFDDIRKALDKAGLPAKVKAEAEKQLSRLEGMHPDSSEATVIRTYLDWIVDIPWKKLSKDQLDISKASAILNEDHYGLDKVKERILEYLSVRKLNPKMKGPILCFVGPPGVGKTSLGRSIARALNRKFVRMSLGGMRDEAEIRGHRRTYIGAMPGRIIQGMKDAQTRNPVFMLDEIDKVGQDFRGDPSSALLEVLDPEQNNSFTDHYLNVPYDLSKTMFICTANMLDTIPSALLDRMEVIRITGYTQQEKIKIARRYLLPRQIKENGIKPEDIQISEAVIGKVIQEYTREAGLRNLERELGGLCRKIARRIAEGKKGPFRITAKGLPKLLGLPKFMDEDRDKELPPGVALGLAWTPYGGETLYIEVSILPGKGKLLLTGQLGDVMKESAQAALSYARSKAEELGLDADFVDKKDIHIHVPAGATPKDGPSAGVTLVTALISALTGKQVRSDVAMTGEITLRGRVMPVGGIKEKVLAAVGAGLNKVIIPAQNENDFKEIPQELRRKIQVKVVENIDEIWPEVHVE
jgi:ATP-dependent Lon protease